LIFDDDGKPIKNTAVKTRMRTIKTRMVAPKNTMKARGKTTSKASTLIKVNGQADTTINHSGPITEGIIWKNGNLRTRRNGQRPPHAWIIDNAEIWNKASRHGRNVHPGTVNVLIKIGQHKNGYYYK
jgi:hypothetical protein